MTELVIRIDPARMLHTAYCSTRDGIVLSWRYIERTWRSLHGEPVVTRFLLADRRTHAKVAVGGALVLAAVFAFVWRVPAPAQSKPKFEETWSENVRPVELKNDFERSVRQIDLSKQAALESKVVKTERITQASVAPVAVAPPPPPPPPPPVQEETPPTPYPRPMQTPPRKRVVEAPVERNICTRHGMRKVEINGGRSWRCRR